jgi:hypothetical protein
VVKDLAEWFTGTICMSLIAAQIISLIWCAIELRKNWWSTSEFWGVDWLDIVCRVEREFGVSLTAADFADWSPEARAALSAGQLWELVEAKRATVAIAGSPAGWPRLAVVLSEALNVPIDRIDLHSRLYGDLGMVRGIV